MSSLRAFGWVAVLESFSWIALLVSMFFSYGIDAAWGDDAISVTGRIHGYLVLVYIGLLFVNLTRYRWGWRQITFDALALLIPGLGFWVAKNAFEEDRTRRLTSAVA